MAYDKVVDSSVLDAGLKTIADAIREKGGTSDNLAFPTAMAEAIAAIEAGGGILANKGSITFADATTKCDEYKITHGMGVIPTMIFVCRCGGTKGSTILDFWYGHQASTTLTNGTVSYKSWTSGALYNGNAGDSLNEETFTIQTSSSWTFAGGEYQWWTFANTEGWIGQ